MRFLVAWHGLDAPGADFAHALSQLEGWAAPLAAWEPALLHARCREYTPAALDQLILNGQLTWFRPAPGAESRQQIVAASPICLVPRKSMASWQRGGVVSCEDLPAASQGLLDVLRAEGAMFADDLQQKTGLLRPQLEQALGTLVARGLVTADAFSALRWLIRPEPVRRRQLNASKRRGGSGSALAAAEMLGRWSVVKESLEQPEKPRQADMETICSALLRRYGVVFRALLERESLLPPWRYVLGYLRRMEDRGEVLGGRFVDGFSGEQFALAEAMGLLQRHVQPAEPYQLATISAADPLNLGGIITPGVRTAALNGHRILLRDGIPLARIQGDDIEILEPDTRVSLEQIQRRLATVRPIRSISAER
jgi:ATP-dependent Lhr-like helicase